MKILLSWLLDYIDIKLQDVNPEKIVHLFNIRTAEIESFQNLAIDYNQMHVVQIKTIAQSGIQAVCPELSKNISLPTRSDAVLDKWYLVFAQESSYRWVLLSDFCADKDGIMPAVDVSQQQEHGAWKQKLVSPDYVFDVDNKSINHRPDLWGHAGIAREIAAFLHATYKPYISTNSVAVVQYAQTSDNAAKNGLTISIENTKSAARFAALACDGITQKDSIIWIAIRLACVGIKPMNAWVDLTNYVMCDIGHPMHIFDAAAFKNKNIIVRNARSGESLQLLDGQQVKLNTQDLVIANDQDAVSLAGIMGGKSSGFQPTTTSIILEAAGFDAATIRTTAQNTKMRSESSSRFEKSLDPMNNTIALQRYVQLATSENMLPANMSYPIVSVGGIITPKTAQLSHVSLQKQLGMPIDSTFVISSLEKIGFSVSFDQTTQNYTVSIPTNRATKDISIEQDLVEEVIRSYGFENIIPQLPMRQTKPFSLQATENIRAIKHQMAYGMSMHEVRDYMMYDASWVNNLSIDLIPAVRVKSPLSENWTTLVTSLIPHLLKSISVNYAQKDHMRFFEYNRTWHKSTTGYKEQKVLAGIFFDKKSVNFYDCKQQLATLFDMLGIEVVYQKPTTQIPAWYQPFECAQLLVNGTVIGFAGMMSQSWMHQHVQGNAFIFEINGQFLEAVTGIKKKFVAWSKFQDVAYDISLFIPFAMTSDELKAIVSKAHHAIASVDIVDFFEKPEWTQHRAVTLRYTMSDFEKTMNKQDIDAIVQSVQTALQGHHVHIR